MSVTKKYREQHDELLVLATEIAGCLNTNELAEDATKARSLLSKLLGKLTLHLVLEDKSLYPVLLAQEDEKIKNMAQKFINEMGGIATAVDNYANTWASAIAIQKEPDEFITQTKGIFNTLGHRINKENKELYAAFDALKANA